MSSRSIISYGDLENGISNQTSDTSNVQPLTMGPPSSLPSQSGSNTTGNAHKGQPPSKKRKRNNKGRGGGNGGQRGRGNGHVGHHFQPAVKHWDEPDIQGEGLMYEDGAMEEYLGEEMYYEEEDQGGHAWEEQSRELTHEEIWDDTALIAAWDAANEEYEVMHGKNKRWKQEVVHKSALWYNVPPENLSTKSLQKAKSTDHEYTKQSGPSKAHADDEQDSRPLDFNTFIPTHDASLSFTAPYHPPPAPQEAVSVARAQIQQTYLSAKSSGSDPLKLPEAAFSGVSVDEAFNRALGAMYWCGYWTACYHVQRSTEVSRDRSKDEAEDVVPGTQGTQFTSANLHEDELVGDTLGGADEEEPLITTQR